MYVRQRTNWVSFKLRELDGSSAPFVIALKINVTNRMPKIISFCKKHKANSFASYRKFLYSFNEFVFLSQDPFMLSIIMTKI